LKPSAHRPEMVSVANEAGALDAISFDT
jgi:hypothetical protein